MICSKLCAQKATNEMQAGFDKPASFPGQKRDNENEVLYNILILIYLEKVRRRSFALLDLQGDATADQHLLFAILMYTEGSHQVVPTWNHVSHWLIIFVYYGCVLAGVCNIAILMTTSE